VHAPPVSGHPHPWRSKATDVALDSIGGLLLELARALGPLALVRVQRDGLAEDVSPDPQLVVRARLPDVERLEVADLRREAERDGVSAWTCQL
jgi:hypothetical protein